jgi:polysaccharide pyruvyl transferase WcaK-like protein
VRTARPGPHFAAGVGIGPFRDTAAEAECRELLRELDFVGARDRISYERARALAPDARVELTFDVAALLPEAADAADRAPGRARHALGIALCHEGWSADGAIRQDRRLDGLAAAIRQALRAAPIDEVVLLDCNRNASRADAAAHLALARRMGGAIPCRHVPYDGNPVALFHAIAGLKGLVAMRLHAAVFAYLARTPALILSYHEKCRGWAEMIGAPAETIFDADRFDAAALAGGVSQLLTAPARPALPLAEAGRRSRRNWEWNGPERLEVPPEAVGALRLPHLPKGNARGGDPEIPVPLQDIASEHRR